MCSFLAAYPALGTPNPSRRNLVIVDGVIQLLAKVAFWKKWMALVNGITPI